MKRSVLAARGLLLALCLPLVIGLGACSWLPKDNDETTGWSAQRLYGEAKDAMGAKNYERAIKMLEKLEARYPYGRFAQQAQLEVSYAYWKAGERASALAAADRFIKLYPGHASVDYAYYLKGLVTFNENQGLLSILDTPDMTERDPKGARDSFEAFKEVVNRFPDSKYRDDAAARMRYLVNSLAQHEVHVARYYMKRGAYVAAANRAQYAVQNYPQAPAVEEAVFIMVKAYDALNMAELRDAADRVMRKNFPKSKYIVGYKPSAPWWKLWDPNW